MGLRGTLRPNRVVWNSATTSGGTNGSCPGIEFGATSSYVSLTGTLIGDQANPSWQAEPMLIDNGAVDLAVVGNVFGGNVSNTVNDAANSVSNQYGLNAGDTAILLFRRPRWGRG